MHMSSSRDHTFLFASLDSKQPKTNRQLHIRRLYDILHVCVQKRDFERANRAWAILARCKEMDWHSLWTSGLLLLDHGQSVNSRSIEYLRNMMLQLPEDREHILTELILRLLLSKHPRDALDELELYLPSFPYQDNPVLHMYAGMAALDLALNDSAQVTNQGHLSDAVSHFDHAKLLDPDNAVVQTFLDKIEALKRDRPMAIDDDSDDDSVTVAGGSMEPLRKRSRA